MNPNKPSNSVKRKKWHGKMRWQVTFYCWFDDKAYLIAYPTKPKWRDDLDAWEWGLYEEDHGVILPCRPVKRGSRDISRGSLVRVVDV